MKLIDKYIYEVTRRLPEKNRDDIALELKSTIEDMLPNEYTEEEIKQTLTKLGSPAELAASYKDKPNYLIGPNLYDTYIGTIKIVVPWAIVIALLVHIVENVLLISVEEALLSSIINAITVTTVNLVSVVFQVLFWITLGFVIVERTDGLNITQKKAWTPDDLKNVKIIPKDKKIPLSDIIFGIIGMTFFTIIYFYADRLVGVYQTADNGNLTFVLPIFNQDTLIFYAPIIIFLIILQYAMLIYKFKIRNWTTKIAAVNLVVNLLGTIVFIFIANNPHLLNEAFIPYMADTLQITSSKVELFTERIIWISVAIFIVTNILDVFNGFRKAKY
ncbi:hypothetical protein [Solibacillus sp. CAU 1738]|uniref:HAAS signaling domain-containing protein n=1 Tax=Solibacillus sp. CAU 1738 TaxID=3140363 RepID=UPI00326066CB